MTITPSTAPSETVTTSSLPRATAVVRAFATTPPGGYGHPVLAVAAALAAEHRLRAGAHQIVCDPRAADPVLATAARTVHAHDAACAALLDRIDRWAATALTEGRTGVLHTESLGQLVGRLVTVWMRGQLMADARAAVDDPRVRLAANQLGELGRAYDDLVSDLLLGRRRLPVLQTPTGPAGMA
ncbi:DUF4254 domain-containing protein [Amycolatopsis sp. H20-H5]|uniref:DUF4254 domain-containing protein n=1 Tax=Amycolatopsis sp. H20-H5 TaxID=3046309 RepID=UPI002DB80F80|nr:DUF4254 domain-containing protein [Amycolatopsis sp. H20-H5]MEC3974284.1 DUF4254 domain-containing protein [Amycolatopsis sp. H20-H5]